MRYCCVLFCTSSRHKKQPSVSFCEIPADLAFREQLLKVTSRKNWQLNSTSDYSAICSLHSLACDFREDTKRYMLKQGSVPRAFPQYPSHLKPVPEKMCYDSSIEHRKCESLPVRTAAVSTSVHAPDPVAGTCSVSQTSDSAASACCVDVVTPDTATEARSEWCTGTTFVVGSGEGTCYSLVTPSI